MGENGVWEDEAAYPPPSAWYEPTDDNGVTALAWRKADGLDKVTFGYATQGHYPRFAGTADYHPHNGGFEHHGIIGLQGEVMIGRPGLAWGSQGRLFAVGVGEHTPHLMTTTQPPGDRWEPRVSTGAWTSAPPALAVFDGYVHCVLRGHGGNPTLYWMKRTTESGFGGTTPLPDVTLGAPALAVFDDKLWCVYKKALMPHLCYMTLGSSHGNWSAPKPIPGAMTDDVPGLAVHDGKLHLIFRRPM